MSTRGIIQIKDGKKSILLFKQNSADPYLLLPVLDKIISLLVSKNQKKWIENKTIDIDLIAQNIIDSDWEGEFRRVSWINYLIQYIYFIEISHENGSRICVFPHQINGLDEHETAAVREEGIYPILKYELKECIKKLEKTSYQE